jgi:hypothetical protein
MDKIRLTTAQVDIIIDEAKRVFGSNLSRLLLYGSRTDITKKGGDIDLAIELFGAVDDKFALTRSLRQGLCARLGEQKFDLLVVSLVPTLNTDRENTFFSLIHGSSKVLWSSYEQPDT